jgi:hypothetical protein
LKSMQQRNRSALWPKRYGAFLGILALGAVFWWGLDRLEPQADWLRVDTPRFAFAGQPLPLRVHLAPLAEPAFLCADLHWAIKRDGTEGFLATGGAVPVGKEGGTFDFNIRVVPRTGLRFVNGIIYLSRTGTWDSHTAVATTDLIAVRSNLENEQESSLETTRMRPLADRPNEVPTSTAIPRMLTTLVLFWACIAAWKRSRPLTGPPRSSSPTGKTPGSETLPELAGGDACATPNSAATSKMGFNARGEAWGLTLGLGMACVCELIGLEGWIGAWVRDLAHAGDFYYPRTGFQKFAISAMIAGLAAFVLSLRRGTVAQRLAWALFGLYVVICLVNLLSLHAIDQAANLSWHGLTLVQALKLACAGLTWYAVSRKPFAPTD